MFKMLQDVQDAQDAQDLRYEKVVISAGAPGTQMSQRLKMNVNIKVKLRYVSWKKKYKLSKTISKLCKTIQTNKLTKRPSRPTR